MTLNIQHLLPQTEYICFIIPRLFSREECEQMLAEKDRKQQFLTANINYPTYYRNNERQVCDDESLAQKLFDKVKTYLPPIIETQTGIDAEQGTWQLKELNHRIRFCRYIAGQYFHRHLDGVHYRSAQVQSKLTFMVYLNGAEDFEGGRTLFYQNKTDTAIAAAYTPRQGDLIVFDHHIWHEGEELKSGEKFVLRSDILYEQIGRKNNPGQEPFGGHLGYIWQLLRLDDKSLISAGRDKSIKIWNLPDGSLRQSLSGHQNSILCLAVGNKSCFVSGSRDQQLFFWKSNKDGLFEKTKSLNLHQSPVLTICQLQEGLLASGGGDGCINVFDIEGRLLQSFTAHQNWLWSLCSLSPQILASCSEDRTIRIWNLATEKKLQEFCENSPIIALAFDAPKRILLSGNLEGEIILRYLDNDFSILNTQIIKAHKGLIRCLKILDNSFFASGAEDNQVKIWSFDNLQELGSFEHLNFVQSIEILDKENLFTASYDGSIGRYNWKKS